MKRGDPMKKETQHLDPTGGDCGQEDPTHVAPAAAAPAPDGLVLSFRYQLERALLEEFRDADYETGLGWEAVVETVVLHLEDAEGQHLVQARAAILVVLFVEWVRRLLWAHDPESRAVLLQLLDDDAISHEADRIQGGYSDED